VTTCDDRGADADSAAYPTGNRPANLAVRGTPAEQLALDAFGRLTATDSLYACIHGLNGLDLFICGEHPALGLLCGMCIIVHLTQCFTEVLRCAVCGAERPVHSAMFAVRPREVLMVRDIEGGEYGYGGVVQVMVAVCASCAEHTP
jgi:hypothetical protein